jgi:asparagine synthase (glutamine-hydrolysing)
MVGPGGASEQRRLAILAMLPTMARRGPDAEGFHAFPNAAFGHRRLSILDLSPAGSQPMLDPSGRYGLVFNGCIYNFLELRAELEAQGCRFRSQCDTEVLLAGLIAWPVERLLPKLRGMFSFAFWDQQERTLTLVRDRLGVKPLYYTAGEGWLAFASSAASLRAAGLVDVIDPLAVLEFLEFGHTGQDRCIWKNAGKLPPGALLRWRDGKTTGPQSYWTLPEPDYSIPVTSARFNAAVEEAESLLLEATRLRLTADVKVGALLSAGIDSTLVCWALRKLNANIGTFTVGTPGDPGDESAAAAATARQLGLAHEIVELPSTSEDNLDELCQAFGEPFAISSALAMLRVSQAVRPHATVLLTGDGGDDVFLGYPHHKNCLYAQKIARCLPPGSAALWRGLRPLLSANALRRPRHLLDYATGGLGAITRVHDGLPYYERHALLGHRLDSLRLAERDIPLSLASGRRLLSDELRYERRVQFSGEFLPKVDGATMHHSLEARAPLLDSAVWEFAARLPYAMRLYQGRLKAIPREIVRRHLGDEIAFRRKQGFTIPVETWLAGRWRDSLERLADGNLLEREGWVRPGSLRPILGPALAAGRVPVQWWRLLVLNRWLERQGGAVSASSAAAPASSTIIST